MPMGNRVRKALVWIALGGLAVGITVFVLRWSVPAGGWSGELADEVRAHRRVAIVGKGDLPVSAPDTERVRADEVPELRSALRGNSGDAVARAMKGARITALYVRPPLGRAKAESSAVQDRLARYEHVAGMRARLLTPAGSVFTPATVPTLNATEQKALGHVARKILGGASPPRVSSFPERLRQVRNVEVLVMLKDGDRPRLWRSSRGSSLARGLLTASIVARQRWIERQQAMGGPLNQQLPRLHVEIMLLAEDGTLADHAKPFVERVFTPAHGVAYERRGNWRYLLPRATQTRGRGSAVRAYQALFAEHALEADSLARNDLRLYRVVARTLARSPAETALPRREVPDAGP